MPSLTLNLDAVIHLSPEQFYTLCRENPELKLERTATGELIVMPPTGGETGRSNLSVGSQLWIWNDRVGLGEAFDSSTGFTLPNGADRSPDAAWVEKSRWVSLLPEQREHFVPLCPDFVVEILSPSDSLAKTQAKMQEYLDNGCRLGWLLNRKGRSVEVYRAGEAVEVLQDPRSLSGETVLIGFALDLRKVWGN